MNINGEFDRWLRTNVGGVLNTCKSNGSEGLALLVSGERVSNT